MYDNKKMFILGMARSGYEVAKVLVKHNCEILITDMKKQDEEKVKEAKALYEKLEKLGIESIIDDRENINFGPRIKDPKVLGTPYIAIFGGKVENGKVELEETKTGKKEIIITEELIERFSQK